MESRVHRLERLLCYVLLAFVGFVDLIHGSLSRDDSRGTSRSSSNTTTTNGSNSNSTGSSGNSSGEGRGSDNSSNNNDNNRNNNNNNNNNNNGNQPSNNGEDAFRPVFAGQYLLPHHPHPPKHLQPVTPLHHQQQQQQQQQQHQYKNLVTSGLFLHLDFNNDERKVVLPINITSLPRPTRNPANFTSDDRGQTFRDVTSDYNDANGTVLRVATKKVANAAARLLWLPDDKSHLEQKRRQHVVISRHRRQAPLYEKTDKTNKKVYFNNTRDPYEILNATRIKINVKDHNTKKSNKRDPNYFLYNTTKQLEKRMKKRPEMLLSDQAVTVRNVDSALLTKRERYGDFNPPLQIAFLKKPPSYDVSETGHTLTYECEVDTSNLTVDPEIYWTIPDRITKEKKGPEDLYPGEFRHDVYVDDNHTLIIKNVQMEHRGMYICVASVGQVTEMVTMVLRVMRVSGYDLFVRLIVGFSVAFVVIVGFGSVWMVLRVLNNRKRRAEEENGPTETTEIRRPTPDVHYFL